MASMAKTLPVSVIQENIYAQLQASRDIFGQIRKLADVAEHEQDPGLREDLEEVMQSLLKIGEDLSEKASATGETVLETVRPS